VSAAASRPPQTQRKCAEGAPNRLASGAGRGTACERLITGRERYCALGAFFLVELERKLVSEEAGAAGRVTLGARKLN
jgi:hypothetical protein